MEGGRAHQPWGHHASINESWNFISLAAPDMGCVSRSNPWSRVILRGAGMAQWWSRSPLTNVSRVQFPDPASYVGWVFCWFSTLLREVFLRVLGFSHFLIAKFQFDPGMHGHFWTSSCELLGVPWVNKLLNFILLLYLICEWSVTRKDFWEINV